MTIYNNTYLYYLCVFSLHLPYLQAIETSGRSVNISLSVPYINKRCSDQADSG